jgi:hypothetical protein
MNPRLTLVLLAGLALSCGGSSPTSPDRPAGSAASCTTLGQCSFVRDTLQSFYYWYKELPNPDPASFASPEAYLEAVRYRPLDSSFSYVTSRWWPNWPGATGRARREARPSPSGW